jgi:hypothetical protein
MIKMFDDIDFYKPDFIIKCRNLISAGDIYAVMSNYDARNFAYAMCYVPYAQDPCTHHIAIPYIGSSSPAETTRSCGERIVRQMANLDNWDKQIESEHGSGFRKKLIKQINNGIYPEDVLDRNNINVGIWNLKFRDKFIKTDSEDTLKTKVEWIEAEVCMQHKTIYKKLPVGNVIDMTIRPNYTKSRIARRDSNDQIFLFS